MGKYKPIEETNACPHCGDDYGYYTKCYAYGWLTDTTEFKGRKKENTEMYSDLSYSRESKFYFCVNCNERIARVDEPKDKNINN